MAERERTAYDNLMSAEENLQRAERIAAQSEYGFVPQYYYDEVARCRKIYDEAQRIRYEVERIVNDFTDYIDTYKRNQQSLTADYTEVIKKSSVFLNKYSEYLQQAQQALGESGAANAAATSAASSNFSVQQSCVNSLRANKGLFSQESWDKMSDGQRASALSGLAVKAGQALGVPVQGVRFYSAKPSSRGYYSGDGFLYLNGDTLSDPTNREDALDTIFHEGRHAFQRAAIQNPSSYGISQDTANKWSYEFSHYISPKMNFDLYQAQSIEADARNFAASVMSGGLN